MQVFLAYMHLKDASVPRRVARRSQKPEPEQLQSSLAKMSTFVRCIKDIADAELHAMDLRTIRYNLSVRSCRHMLP